MRKRAPSGQMVLPGFVVVPSKQRRHTAHELTPFERGPVVGTLRGLNTFAGPVRSSLLADHLGKSERTARWYLARLERAGLVQRPRGPRSGWVAVW